MSNVRVRFAPSPTGHLHVGGLRTALYNYLFAAHHKGKIILRIEDTDQKRKVEGAVENLQESLSWVGIHFDEGPNLGGEYGPYFQSQRSELYLKYVTQLVDQGDAYYCFCTTDELDAMRKEQAENKEPVKYNGKCRNLKKEEIEEKLAQGIPKVIRMKIQLTRGDYIVKDLARGNVQFPASQIDDQVLLKSDGFPTYHLASVVDDHLMEITHVIRGEEWLPSTPKHIQLYEYFGWEPPQFTHLPLLLNPDRSKMSKRQGDVATEDYRAKGYLPECLANFVAILGWNISEKEEIFSLEEMVDKFSLEGINKAGVVFDQAKLKWMNQSYIKSKSLEELMGLLHPFLPAYALQDDPERVKKIVQVVRDRLVTLADIEEALGLFYKESPELKESTLREISAEESAQKVYQTLLEEIEKHSGEWTSQSFMTLMKAVQKSSGVKGKQLWIPVRIAITLEEHGPDLPLVAEIFGKEKCSAMVKKLLQNK